MEKRDFYETAMLEIITFDNSDVITTSIPSDDAEGNRYDL